MNIDQATIIEKEALRGFTFPKKEIPLSDEEISLRNKNIHRATKLGNNSKNKCRIIFHDGKGLKLVETTIWAHGTENISLKYGVTIPINRVAAVKIF